MNVCGIVSEYNPFHNGHQYQIDYARQHGATHVAAIMSGHVVQRGDVACLSKWTRAKAALLNGVDLVLELPAVYSLASAERFAYGAVSILDRLGAVDSLCFGSESGEIEPIMECAKACLRLHDDPLIKELLTQGLSYPRAREQAISQLYSKEMGNLLAAPNNILGIEYCKALLQMQSIIQPFTLKREGAAHDSALQVNEFASASLLRDMLCKENLEEVQSYVPSSAYALYKEEYEALRGAASNEYLERAILYALRSATVDDFRRLPDVTEGLENRLSGAAKEAVSLRKFYEKVKTKRYTLSRLRRIVYSLLVGNRGEYIWKDSPYVRVLGANQRGYEILKRAKENTQIYISSSFADIQARHPQFTAVDERASDLFTLALPNIQPGGRDYTEKFISL